MKWTLILLAQIFAMTILTILASGTVLLLVLPLLTAFGGWQIGILMGRQEPK